MVERKSLKKYFTQKYVFYHQSETKQPQENIVEIEELENLAYSLRDLVSEECIIISKLKAKDFSIRGWGTIDNELTETSPNETLFVIDNAN